MAERLLTAMTLEELAEWLGNKKREAYLTLTDLYYEPSRKREILVQSGQVGYYLRRSWIKLQQGDVVQFRDMDVEIV